MPPGLESVFIAEFAKNGVLGLVILALGFLGWTQRKEIAAIWGERLKDWQAVMEILNAVKTSILELVNTTQDRTKAQENQARAGELLAQQYAQLSGQFAQLTSEVSQLRVANKELTQEFARFREAYLLSRQQGQGGGSA